MTGRLLAALAVAALAAGPAEARPAPPAHPHSQAAKKRAAAHRRALARKQAAARRRAAAKRKQLEQAQVQAAVPLPADAPVTQVGDPVVPPVITDVVPPVATAPLPHVVNITARDNTLTPSRTLVGTGSVYVEFVNRGEDPHDLHIARDGQDVESWPVLAGWDGLTIPPLDARSIDLTAGTYRLYCALHSGMETGLTVSG